MLYPIYTLQSTTMDVKQMMDTFALLQHMDEHGRNNLLKSLMVSSDLSTFTNLSHLTLVIYVFGLCYILSFLL
mgnify:CR=1 FL=1